jgi:hypothetical protein
MIAQTCNSSTWEAEAGGSQIWGQPGLHSYRVSLGYKGKTLSQKKCINLNWWIFTGWAYVYNKNPNWSFKSSHSCWNANDCTCMGLFLDSQIYCIFILIVMPVLHLFWIIVSSEQLLRQEGVWLPNYFSFSRLICLFWVPCNCVWISWSAILCLQNNWIFNRKVVESIDHLEQFCLLFFCFYQCFLNFYLFFSLLNLWIFENRSLY